MNWSWLDKQTLGVISASFSCILGRCNRISRARIGRRIPVFEGFLGDAR